MTWRWRRFPLSLLLVLSLWGSVPGADGQPSFNRGEWGVWSTKDCLSTRERVLIRDATGPLLYRDDSRCKVAHGTWKDPYTGGTIHDPEQMDVDHVVPLKHAWRMGGRTWAKDRKVAYANNLVYIWHLQAVSLSENRKKGDRGPDEYIPPNSKIHCQYGQAWSSVKLVWGLRSSAKEREAVSRLLASCGSAP